MKKPSLKYLKSLEGKFIQIIHLGEPIFFNETEELKSYIEMIDMKEIYMLVDVNPSYKRKNKNYFCAKLVNSSLKMGYICYHWDAIKEIKVVE